jgi:transcriptional regulator with GAF, ATPase, and Fis domain
MISIFKDHYRVGQLLAVLFIIGVAISLYQIYTLPEGLSIMSGYRQAFFPVYMVLGFTFILGFFTIYYTLQHRREIIVFRDKKLEQDIIDRENSVKNTISLDGVKESLNADDRKDLLRGALHAICKQVDAGQGAIYEAIDSNGVRKVELKSGYALNMGESTVVSYEFGEGLIGQAAANGKTLYIDDVPEGYIKIVSGLGSASPRFLLIVPLKAQEKTTGVIEIASFSTFTPDQKKFVEDAAQLIGNTISTQ